MAGGRYQIIEEEAYELEKSPRLPSHWFSSSLRTNCIRIALAILAPSLLANLICLYGSLWGKSSSSTSIYGKIAPIDLLRGLY